MTYASLEDVGRDFFKATQVETNSLFVQGEIVLQAAVQGFGIDEVCAHCAGLVQRSKRTIYRRYAVSRTFVKPHPALTTSWEAHAICADLIDYRNTDADVIATQVEAAHKWLDMAAAEQWSTRQLRAAMVANGDDPDAGKPEVLLNNAEAIVMNPLYGGHEIKLHLLEELDFDIPIGSTVIVSLVKAPTQEKRVA